MRRGTREQTYTTITAGICSGLSVVGSFYILGRYWYVRCMKARAVASKYRGGGVRRVDVTQELIHVLAWLDLIGALGRGFGSIPTFTYDQSKGEPSTWECKLQAFAISFSDVSAITWNFLMAFNLYRWVCLGEDQQRLQKTIKWYILVALAAAGLVTGLALGYNVYGDAHVWCWISIPGEPTRELYWKLSSLYIWILLLAFAMCVILVLVKLNVQRRLEGVDNEDGRIAYKGVVQTLTIYIVAFIMCWVPPLINRIYAYVMGEGAFTLMMLHASIVSIQGFVNAVIYGKFHVWMARHLVARERYDRPLQKQTKYLDGSRRVSQLPARNRHLEGGIATIFVTTHDMNWTVLPKSLDEWIPQGKDVYAFTLLHCMGVQGVEQAIREHLLRVNYPMGYRSIISLAGGVIKGNLEGAATCQMIFVNNSDVASGNFKFQSADGRQWAQRKSNKNVLGIPIRYFDASIAFVACNLRNASVTSPKQVPTSLAAKHAATTTLIRSLAMGVDKSGVEFPHLYHHTFLAGDLNYDIAKPKSQLTSAIDQAYRAECLKRASDSTTRVSRNSHRENFNRLTPLAKPRSMTLKAPLRDDYTPQQRQFDSPDMVSRASFTSQTVSDSDGSYEVVFSEDSDGVTFTELRSPGASATSVNGGGTGGHGRIAIDIEQRDPRAVPHTRQSSSWREFLDSMLPSASSGSEPLRGRWFHDGYDFVTSPQDPRRAFQNWMQRTQFADGSAQTSWKELLQHDQLLQAIQAKEVLCGFEEPLIAFLPTYPRQVGVSAVYSMPSTKSCSDLFGEGQPAYADRILTHSLPDTRKRLRNVGYWVCEEVTASNHRPVCSVYELEIDRFYAYKNIEASRTDVQAGNVALRDKTNVREFKIKLVNLDANMWTYQSTARQSMNPLRRLRSPSLDSILHGNDMVQSPEEPTLLASSRSPERVIGKPPRRSLSSRLLDSKSRTTHRRSLRESIDNPLVELVPIEPSHIATVFPLPSEDIFALQRKVHEVAHSVQTGFLSSSHSKEAEEASLAFTNSRTVTWKEATTHGVVHSAIAKPVNGVLHFAINVQGSGRDQGGQGILCVNESDLIGTDDLDATIPFDIPLTWGGKLVGYLHGDIVRRP